MNNRIKNNGFKVSSLLVIFQYVKLFYLELRTKRVRIILCSLEQNLIIQIHEVKLNLPFDTYHVRSTEITILSLRTLNVCY